MAKSFQITIERTIFSKEDQVNRENLVGKWNSTTTLLPSMCATYKCRSPTTYSTLSKVVVIRTEVDVYDSFILRSG